MASVLLVGLFLAGIFFCLNIMLRRCGDERLYRRVTIISSVIVITLAWGLFAATHLGFIPDHAP